jgi:RNA polymerase sigma-70 factor (ECF subfamily)
MSQPRGTNDRGTMFERNGLALRRFVRRLVPSEDEAEELFQDVAVVVIAHSRGPEDESSFPVWCQGVARHLAAHRRRSVARLRARLAPWDELDASVAASDEADPERLAITRQQVAARLVTLDESSLDLVFSRFVAEQTPTEMAERLNISPASMRMRLMRLRSVMRAALDDNPLHSS